MKSFIGEQNSEPRHFCHGHLVGSQDCFPVSKACANAIRPTLLQWSMIAVLLTFPILARSQVLPFYGDDSASPADTTSGKISLPYVRPTEKTMISNYAFATFGPYPAVFAAISAGVDQENNAPPEWSQGAAGYARRFGSNYGILAVGSTTRYTLSEAFHEDAMYYRCECSGVFPRTSHAVLSTFTARRGKLGHRVFSIPALVAPYVGSMTATYAWYPSRFGAKDAFRMGNYSMLRYIAGNISLEFLYSGPHSLISRMHLNNTHGSPIQGPNK